MIPDIVIPKNIDDIIKSKEMIRFMLFCRDEDNNLVYLRFEDFYRNTHGSHPNIVEGFEKEVEQNAENISISQKGGGYATFLKRDNIHIRFFGQSGNYGRVDHLLLERLMENQKEFTYEIQY
ncbi:MAG: hypothetical protein AABX19_01685 [Nanoarchaeota archaeon]